MDNLESDTSTAGSNVRFPEPLAIVGTGMRLPGEVRTTEDLWALLIAKVSARSRVPEDRFNVDAFYSSSGRPGAMRTAFGHFLTEPNCLKHLDTHMFPILKKELDVLDPQERLLLEVVYECMQNAGQTDWRGQNIGCFVGTFGEDWSDLYAKDSQAGGVPGPHRICGQHDFALANRVSYEFDFRGPSCTTKSACSSSLMALHSAARAIAAGDCKMAIVAGTSLIFTPTGTASMWPALSPDGTCKSFDASANGYARGEAINAILVKPLADAIQHGDAIRAIIRGTAVNFDGKTSSLAVPSSLTHEVLMRKAYLEAALDPKDTPFIEAHGTGTAVGDAIEVNAIVRVFGSDNKVFIGSIKPNLGHSEGASGLNSVLKCVAALENRAIPPNIFFDKANPKIPLQANNLEIPIETTPWPENMPHRASVNCFGIAGANAHVVLESLESFDTASGSLPRRVDVADKPMCSGPRLLVLSAACEKSLAQSILEHQQYAQSNRTLMQDLAYTLCKRREHLAFRSFCVANDTAIMFTPPQKRRKGQSQVNMVFAGQGTQWIGMASDLITDLPDFENDIDELSDFLSRAESPPQWTIKQRLLERDTACCSNDPSYAQPIMAALQIALVRLLRRWGINAAVVVGHSSGEIAAAYTAGAITAEEAMLIAYYRGTLVSSLSRQGSMVAVSLSKPQILPLLEEGIVVACENSAQNVTLSGDVDAMDASRERIRESFPDAFIKKLNVETAYHSPHMREIAEAYEHMLRESVTCKSPCIPMFSSVTGDIVSENLGLDSAYWRMNMESPVLFRTAMENLIGNTAIDQIFIEIGPQAALAGPIRQTLGSLERPKDIYLSALQRNHNSTASILELVGTLHCSGILVNFDAESLVPRGKLLTNLPLYQWTHDKEYWSESRVVKQWRFKRHPHHELLGSRTMESNDLQPEWRNVLHMRDVPWLQDHRVQDQVVFPFAGYIAMAAEALRRITDTSNYIIRHVTVLRPLLLNEVLPVELMTSLRPARLTATSKSTRWEFNIVTLEGQTWSEICHGEIESGKPNVSMKCGIERHVRNVSNHYFAFKKLGLQYGSACQLLHDVTVAPMKMTASAFILSPPASESTYAVHPTVIDNCLQLTGIAACEGIFRHTHGLHLPVTLENLYLCGITKTEASITAQAIGITKNPGEYASQTWAFCQDKVLLHCQKVVFRSLPGQTLSDNSDTVAGAKLLWRPDVEHINLSTTSPGEFIRLLGHSNPILRILHVHPDGSCDVAPEDVLQNLVTKAGHAQYATYNYASASHDAIKSAQLDLKEYEGIHCEQLESRLAPVASDRENEAFDFIVVAWEYLRAHTIELRRLLHPHGWLLVFDCRRETHTIEEVIGSAGFCPARSLASEDDTLPKGGLNKSIIVTRSASRSSPPKRLTLLVPAGEPSVFVLSVRRHLENQVVSIDVRTLHQETNDTQDIISLLDAETPFLDNIAACDFVAFQKLMQRIAPNAVLWIMRSAQISSPDPRYSLSLGLLRTVRQELGLSIATMEIDSLEDASLHAMDHVLSKLHGRKVDDMTDPDYEYVLEAGVVKVGRYHPVSVQKEVEAFAEHTRESKLVASQVGLLESLKWSHYDYDTEVLLGSTQVVVRVKAVGINFKDILISMGVLDPRPLGVEGAGIVEDVGSEVTDLQKGDRVFFMENGSLATSVKLPASSCIKLPLNLSFEEAATMPCVYSTAIHCLMDLGRLREGESVLIHSACGGVGLAAIQLCQKVIGADIYVTVGSEEKAQHLVSVHGIPRDRIFDSRTKSFHDQIMSATGSRGVDLVLNSLSGELLHMSWKCVAEFGRMIEIGKRDLIGRAKLSMDLFGSNRSFSGVDLASMQPSKLRLLMDRTIQFFDEGLITPITPMEVFSAEKTEEAFRYMQSGSRMGKVIVSMPEDPSKLSATCTAPKVNFNSEATYVLVGGLGAMGKATSTWMVEHGARHFIYISRSAGQSDKDVAFLAELACQGCSAQAIAGSVADSAVVRKAVSMAPKPIKGMFQLSMALPNMPFLDMSHPEWTDGLVAKVDGTWNLHRELPQDLDFFVLASSIGGCFGHIGQANYAAANTFLDAFVHYRHRQGLSASVIDIGLVGDMGYIMEHAAVYERFRAAGSYFVGEQECLTSFQWAMLNGSPRLPSDVSHGRISMGIRTLKPLSSPDNHLPWVRDRRMALYRNLTLDGAEPGEENPSDKLKQFMARVKLDPALLDKPEALKLVTREIGVRLYTALMRPIEDISLDQTLEELGVDSLVLMEMRNWSKRSFGGAEISTLDFLNAGSIRALGVVAIDAVRKKLSPQWSPERYADTERLSENQNGLQHGPKSERPEEGVFDITEHAPKDKNASDVQTTASAKQERSIPNWIPPVFIPENVERS